MSNKIRRKIHFFHFEFLESNPGSNAFIQHSKPMDTIKEISQFQFLGERADSRFKYHSNGDVTFLIDAHIDSEVIKGKFAISRRSALPELETGGQLKPLDIPINSGLAEITHFIYFPKQKVIGVEFNFYGPRASSLKNYLLEKSNLCSMPFEYIELNPILNQDLDVTLQDVGEVNLFTMEISRNELGVVNELNQDLHSAFEAAAKVSEDAESVEVILRKKKYSRGGFRFPLSKNKLKEFLSIGDNRQAINRLKINAESRSEENNKTFDLLEDKMITSKKVTSIGGRSRSVDSNSMFDKIEEAFTELSPNFNSES
ncbi:hypothetical protein ACK1LH_19680 [Metabacillus indicus]|uniref:hypothetical protein n=1 Tax=Metabacillus TaxID=2675233 RepID=UPI001939604A|nr:hypothetical protein [Metabacillus sp. cB07]